MANLLLCDRWVFVCLSLFYLHLLRHSLFVSCFTYFVICDILPKLYNYITLFRCITKSNYWGEDTAYCPHHTISQQSPCHVSDLQSVQRNFFEHGSFHLPNLTINIEHFTWFSPGTFHSPVSTLTLTLRTHTNTTVHAKQCNNSAPSLTKTPLCVCLNNINKEPSQQVGVLYTENSWLVSGLNICRALCGQRWNWYIIIPFWTLIRITPHQCGKDILKIGRRKWKILNQ